MNSSAAVCVRRCPRLADELACEYPFEAVPIAQQRQQLGSRCFSQIRTRPSFPACLPHQPAAAAAVDRWLSAHAVDQLAADTLQASAVILGCWCAAGLAALLSLAGLVLAPRLTLLLTMVAALVTALGGASMLLPHGARMLALARAPHERGEALYLREEVPGVLQFALGWAACAGVALLVLTLSGRARHAPLAASMLATAANPLRAMPQLVLLPLYLFIAVGVPLSSWVTAVIFLASPCGHAEGCSTGAMISRIAWPLTLAAPYWLAAAVTAWTYCAVGGVVGGWYNALAPPTEQKESAPAIAASVEGGESKPLVKAAAPSASAAPATTAPLGSQWPHGGWPLWRCGWLALDAHFGSIGAAAFLLPLASLLRIIVPPVAPPAPRSVNPYSRACLGAIQGCLRLFPTLTRAVHPGALVYLARHPPVGPPGGAGAGGPGGPEQPTADTFLTAGDYCADLFASSAVHVAHAREQCHYFYSLIKWTISLLCALVGWLCLTADAAPPLLSPLWPAAIVLEGSLALVSAALSVHEAALEAVLQSYIVEAAANAKRAKDALAAIEAMEAPKSAPAAASTPERASASTPAGKEKLAAQRAASLFGSSTVGEGPERKSLSPTGAEEGSYPQLTTFGSSPSQLATNYGTLSSYGGGASYFDDAMMNEAVEATEADGAAGEQQSGGEGEEEEVGIVPLAASALARA